MTISLEMVVPGLAGYWLDTRLGTVAAMTLIGFALGMTLAIWHLIKLTSPGAKTTKSNSRDTDSSDTAKPR